jgi:hypothetical protein
MSRIAIATATSGLLAAGTFTAITVLAGTAHAGTADSCTGTGAPISCTISAATITLPATIELNAETSPSGQTVDVSWSTNCTLAGQTQAESGGEEDTTPAWDALTLGFANPDSCTVTAKATIPNSNSSATSAPTLRLNLDYNPQAGASPTDSASASASPSPAPTYHVARGFGGKCIDDAGNSSSVRAKIQIWSCNSSDAAQGLTYSNSELKHNNLCLNAKGNGKSGSKIILWTCNGSANEVWTHKSNGEFVEKANGSKLCLNDPGYSTKNGTQLIVWACNNAPNEHWSQP